MKRKLLIAASLIFGLLIVATVGFSAFIGKAIVAAAERYGPAITKSEITLENAGLSPWTGSASIAGLVVGNPAGFAAEHAMAIEALRVKLQPLTLFGDKVVIEEIVIESPEIVLETGSQGTNLKRLLDNADAYLAAEEEAAAEEAPGKKLQIGLIRIVGARARLTSDLARGQSIDVELPEIELTDIGTGPEGATVGDVARRVLASVNREALAALAQSGKAVGDQLKGLGDQLKRSGDKAKEDLNRLLDAFGK